MVDGADMQRGTVVAGNRCYYLKGVLSWEGVELGVEVGGVSRMGWGWVLG